MLTVSMMICVIDERQKRGGVEGRGNGGKRLVEMEGG